MGIVEGLAPWLYLSACITLGLIAYRLLLGGLIGADPVTFAKRPRATYGVALIGALLVAAIPPLYGVILLITGFGVHGRRWL